MHSSKEKTKHWYLFEAAGWEQNSIAVDFVPELGWNCAEDCYCQDLKQILLVLVDCFRVLGLFYSWGILLISQAMG